MTTTSTPSDPAGEVMPLEAFGRDLMRRREAAGFPELPRNAGNRRTTSKRALLAAIDKAGGRW